MWICFKHKKNKNDFLKIDNLENWIYFSYNLGFKDLILFNPNFILLPDVCQFFERNELYKYWLVDTMKYNSFPKEIFDKYWIEYYIEPQYKDDTYNWNNSNYPNLLKTYFNQFEIHDLIRDYIEIHKNDLIFKDYNSEWSDLEFLKWIDDKNMTISFYNECIDIWNYNNKFKKEPYYKLIYPQKIFNNLEYDYITNKFLNKNLYWDLNDFNNMHSYFFRDDEMNKWITFIFSDNKFEIIK